MSALISASSHTLHYHPPPTVRAFMRCNKLVRGLMGPMGSGKSTACVIELLRRAAQQPPAPPDSPHAGLRRSRWLLVRNTYPELHSTTLRTVQDWIPPNAVASQHASSPPRQLIKFADVEAEFLYLALDRADDVRKLLSLDITGAWLNEARELPAEVLTYLLGRVGRFPSAKDGGAGWRGVILDTNPPDIHHWWYHLFEENPAENVAVFKQPSGLGPHAENSHNLPPDYYPQLAAAMDAATTRVMVHGEYGFVKSGQPVFASVWNDDTCISHQPLAPLPLGGNQPRVPVVVGLDFGLTPAAVFLQKQGDTWAVLHELVSTGIMGAEQFAAPLQQLMNTHFDPRQPFVFYGDPAGQQRAQTDARTAYDVLRAHGIPVRPSPTQNLSDRLTCVRQTLPYHLRLNAGCVQLRKGFNGAYHYKKDALSGYKPEPEKNDSSHVMDALQYALAGGGEYAALHRRKNIITTARTPRPLAGTAAW